MFIAPKYSIRVPHPRAGKVVRIESERQIYYTGAWAKDAKLAGLAPDSNRLWQKQVCRRRHKLRVWNGVDRSIIEGT